jgi:hypothetical protein
MSGAGIPIPRPVTAAEILLRLTGAATLAAGSFLVGQGSATLASTGTGLTFASNTLTVGAGSAAAIVIASASVTTFPEYRFYRGGVARWRMRTLGTESGSDTGGSFDITACTDAGTAIDAPLSIVRAAGGAITLARPVTCTGALTAPNGTAAAPGIRTTTYAHGLYSVDASNLGFATDGVLSMSVAKPNGSTTGGSLQLRTPTAGERAIINISLNTSYLQLATDPSLSGGGLKMYGPSHATKANYVEVIGTGTPVATFDGSGNLSCTGTVTVPNGSAAAPGIRTTTYAHGMHSVGATTLGIDVAGIATLEIEKPGTGTGGAILFKTAADGDYCYFRSDRNNAELRIAAGSGTSTGGNMQLFGSGHTTANTGYLRSGTNVRMGWDATGIGFFGTTPVARPSLAAASGTATRTTFDTATVTLPQLAERVKAMIDDLRGYGLAA